MNTDDLNPHEQNNLAIYHGFMTFSKIICACVAVTLILMAIFLL